MAGQALGPGLTGESMSGASVGFTDFLRSLRSRIDSALEEFGVADGPPPTIPDGVIRRADGDGDTIEFSYLGRSYRVSSIQLLMMFNLGQLVQVKIPDPVMNQGTKVYGVSPTIEAFLRTLGVLPPGDYAYRLSSGDYATWLAEHGYTSNNGNQANQQNPGGGNFTGANVTTDFFTKVIAALDLSNLTYFLDNQTNQPATLYALSCIDANGDKNGQFANVAVPAGSLLPVGVNLDTTTIPYLKAQAHFATAPTTGYIRILALGRRAI